MFKQLSMNRFVHFAGQNLFGTGDGEHRNLTAELFANTLHFLGGFRASGFENAVGFDLSLGLGVLDNLLTQLFAVGHKIGSTGASIGFNRLALLRGDARSPLLAAASPSAICFCRSSIALINGGQMYFMVIQAPRKNTTICTNREALIFIIEPRYEAAAKRKGFSAASSSLRKRRCNFRAGKN